jgi:hypothetical protein
MPIFTFRLLEDRLPALPPGTHPSAVPGTSLPAAHRVVYVVEGGLTLAHPAGGRGLLADDAWIGSAAVTLVGGAQGARVWRYEVVATPEPDRGLLARDSAGTESRRLRHDAFELDPATGWMLRCDRVDFPKGAIAYTHVHQGPGLRCCLHGEIRVESGGESHTMRAGEPWFERGPEPVIAYTSTAAETAFARAMVLPRSCKGKSSIRYVRPEDQDKPRLQRYRVYGEEFIAL